MVEAFKKEITYRIFDESLARIVKCLHMLQEDQIWYRPNANSNSVGNIVIHICGNIRQYIMYGIAQEEDIRVRKDEFAMEDHKSKEELMSMLSILQEDVQPVIKNIKKEQILLSKRIQCFDLTVMSILVHVTEHLSYHVGQITYITKMLLDVQTAYYDGKNLG